jgi:hypothetical protein
VSIVVLQEGEAMGRFREALQEDFIIVAISSGLTIDVESNRLMGALIEACKPSYWEIR